MNASTRTVSARRLLAGLAFAGALAVLPPAPVRAAPAPDSFADLAQTVTPAVVNISATQVVDEKALDMPKLPPGSPLDDMFEEYLKRRRQQNGEGHPHRSSRSARAS